ncbi:MAG: hypothetical protein OHK0015_04840 [Chloroflexi bacterium OHK40]
MGTGIGALVAREGWPVGAEIGLNSAESVGVGSGLTAAVDPSGLGWAQAPITTASMMPTALRLAIVSAERNIWLVTDGITITLFLIGDSSCCGRCCAWHG